MGGLTSLSDVWRACLSGKLGWAYREARDRRLWTELFNAAGGTSARLTSETRGRFRPRCKFKASPSFAPVRATALRLYFRLTLKKMFANVL